jgi:[ribosomal protein S5]-alanine N-acetyltransferase
MSVDDTESVPLKSIRIETDRLVLREFQNSDNDRIVALFSEPESQEFILSKQRNPEVIQRFVSSATEFAGRVDRIGFQFVVELRETGETIGNIGISNVWRGSTATTIGWHFGASYARRGYATEAAKALLRYSFLERQVSRVRGDCFAANSAAIRVFHKIGMRRRLFAGILDRFLNSQYAEASKIVRFTTTSHDT